MERIEVNPLYLKHFGNPVHSFRNDSRHHAQWENPIFKWIATIYIEFVRNVPNLLWIFTVFLVFQMKSTPAGITAFTIFTTAAMAEIIRGGLNAIGPGQTEAGLSQGFTPVQIMVYIIMPQAIRKMLPAIISQIVTVIKDTSFLYSVIALQELFGSSQILMGRYFEAEQVFALYIYGCPDLLSVSTLLFQACHVMWLSLGRAV